MSGRSSATAGPVAFLRTIGVAACVAGVLAAGAARPAFAGAGTAPFTDPSGMQEVPAEIRAPEQLVTLLKEAEESSPALRTLRRERELAASRHRAGLDALLGASVRIETPVRVEDRLRDDGENGAGARIRVSKPLGRASAVDASIGVGAGWSPKEGRVAGAPAADLSVVHMLGESDNPARERLDYELRRAEHEFDEGRREWVGDVLDGYAELTRAASDEKVARLRRRLEAARLLATDKRHASGDSSVAELQEATGRAGDAEDALALAEIAAFEARQALELLTGVAFAERMDGAGAGADWSGALRAVPQLAQFQDGDPDWAREPGDWVETALMNRVEPRLAAAAAELARDELDYARRQTGWSGQLAAGIAYPDPDEDIGAWDDASPVWHVGATLSFPLIDGEGAERVERARLKLAEAEGEARLVKRRIAAEVTATLPQVEVAERRLARAQRRRDQAADHARFADESRAAGLDTDLSVLAAELALAEAERALLDARLHLLTETVGLWHTIGRNAAW